MLFETFLTPQSLPSSIQPLFILPSLGFGELAIIFVIVLILFGPGKLPEVCRALGDGLRQFKNASKDVTNAMDHPKESKKLTEKPTQPDEPK
jgi:sec-independent protein translocase protein TatA